MANGKTDGDEKESSGYSPGSTRSTVVDKLRSLEPGEEGYAIVASGVEKPLRDIILTNEYAALGINPEARRSVPTQLISAASRYLDRSGIDPDSEEGESLVRIAELGGRFYELAGQVNEYQDIGIAELTGRHSALQARHEETEQAYKKLEERLEQAEKLAMEDTLTGTGTRRHYDDALKRSMAEAIRGREKVSLVFFDLDHFREVNEKYGWTSGDRVLKRAAEKAKKIVRASDTLSRYGGEEFIVICPDTNLEGAVKLAEKIRAGIKRGTQNLSLDKGEGTENHRQTASFGVATWDYATYPLPSPGGARVTTQNQERAGLDLQIAAAKAAKMAKRAGRDMVQTGDVVPGSWKGYKEE